MGACRFLLETWLTCSRILSLVMPSLGCLGLVCLTDLLALDSMAFSLPHPLDGVYYDDISTKCRSDHNTGSATPALLCLLCKAKLCRIEWAALLALVDIPPN
uniref:Uncharacterized protein n=1 Tax=Opuntia streptacantha TaxID=393608 RepID=A0A7C9DBI3_OPUST